MSERINKLYKPEEFIKATDALGKQLPGYTEPVIRDILLGLHKDGYRIVYVGKIES